MYFNDQYYHDIGVLLKSLQKEIKGEKPFASMREAKDQTILSKIKRGTSLSDLRENDKMTTEDETYFNQYYQQGQKYKNGTISTDDYKDWINSLKNSMINIQIHRLTLFLQGFWKMHIPMDEVCNKCFN